MDVVKIGSNNIDVLLLQSRLGGLAVDGSFGAKTEAALKEYQKSKNLIVDGICGNNTWKSFTVEKLSKSDYEKAASVLDCDVASIMAVASVESSGNGFIELVRPSILFEGHIFYKELKNNGINPSKYTTKYPNIVYRTWDKSKYKGGVKEYDRIGQAWQISPKSAMLSASIGMFQIMGKNYKLCGCASVQEMWSKTCVSEKEQLLLFCHLIANSGIDKYLRKHDWKSVAMLYNGVSYAKNGYDEKMENAYKKFK